MFLDFLYSNTAIEPNPFISENIVSNKEKLVDDVFFPSSIKNVKWIRYTGFFNFFIPGFTLI